MEIVQVLCDRSRRNLRYLRLNKSSSPESIQEKYQRKNLNSIRHIVKSSHGDAYMGKLGEKSWHRVGEMAEKGLDGQRSIVPANARTQSVQVARSRVKQPWTWRWRPLWSVLCNAWQRWLWYCGTSRKDSYTSSKPAVIVCKVTQWLPKLIHSGDCVLCNVEQTMPCCRKPELCIFGIRPMVKPFWKGCFCKV